MSAPKSGRLNFLSGHRRSGAGSGFWGGQDLSVSEEVEKLEAGEHFCRARGVEAEEVVKQIIEEWVDSDHS